jgi:YHS domain-containing protein
MLLRAVALLIVVVIAISFIRRLFTVLQAPRQERFPTAAASQLVKDPVCGTYVAKQTALSARNKFFCSEQCRSKFLTDSPDFHPRQG